MSPHDNCTPICWTLSRVADLAFVASLAGSSVSRMAGWPSDRGLEGFWEVLRHLRHGWQQALSDSGTRGEFPTDLLAEILVGELPIRVWATVLLCGRDATRRDDLHQIVKHASAGLEPVRRQVYQLLLNPPASATTESSAVDTLRRRCERWTDMLAGPAALSADVWDFVCDPRRARDFAEEALGDDESPTSVAVEKLATAGLRMAFLKDLPGGGRCTTDFEPLARVIQAELPPHLAAEVDRISPWGRAGSLNTSGARVTRFDAGHQESRSRINWFRNREANP